MQRQVSPVSNCYKMELVSKVPRLLDRLRMQLYHKNYEGLEDAIALFQEVDHDGSLTLTRGKFESLLTRAQVFTTSPELSELFRYFDTDKDNLISRLEYIQGLKPELSPSRYNILNAIWRFLDQNSTGRVATSQLRQNTQLDRHPRVQSGHKSVDQVTATFERTVGRYAQGGTVNEESFYNIFLDLASLIPLEYDKIFLDGLLQIFGIGNSGRVDQRVAQMEALIYEKVRQKCRGNDDEGKTMMRAFRFFDLDESGQVSFEEFVKALEQFGCTFTPQEMRVLFQKYDVDRSGGLDYGEFVKIFAKKGAAGPHAYGEQPPVPVDVLNRVKGELLRRGAHGIRGLGIVFRRIDNNRDRALDRHEFEIGLRENGHILTPIELDQLFRYFDRNRDGKVSYDEFLRAIRGDLNTRRRQLIGLAYQKLDKNKDGRVNIEDMRIAYDVSYHPDYQQGRKTADQILTEFMSQWDTINRDGLVTLEEFEDYYKDISASVDTDDEFELIIRNAWHIAGGEGWCENTTIPRYLKTEADGTQRVVMAEGHEDFNYSKNLNTSWGGEIQLNLQQYYIPL